MAANARFESASASSSEAGFSGPYSNGKRGSLDRPGSFREGREGTETRMFNSGFAVTRSGSGSSAAVASGTGSLPPLSQCLSLEPIQIGDRKSDRSGELKRVMGIIAGSGNEDGSSGAAVSANSKPSSPNVAEDLKRLRSSVVDTCNTARGRASKLDERLHKLDKYCDGVNTKKTQRNDLMTNDQAGSTSSKIGTQVYRNPAELVNQRVEDRPKNVLLNKRVRTSVAETRSDLRSNGLRKQPVVMAKDRDSVKDNAGESDISEDKIQRLPVGGEGWDKKMKRKRSVGTVCTRPMDNNGEPKRTVQNKVASEPVLQSNDTHPYRLGASNGTASSHKSDKSEGSSLPNGSRARLSPRNELEGPTRDITSGPNKERVLTKGSIKLNTRDDNYIPGGNLVTKGKATRTSRNGVMVPANSTPSTPRLSGTPESWENVTGGSKIPSTSGAINRKRAMPTGPPSPNMAQWVGQRPQKISRTRRANLVSPVSNQEEKPLSSDSCSHSDVSVRLASEGTNGPVVSKPLKPKLEPVQSPYRVSESEESVGGQTVGPSLAVGMKAKSVIKEESGEGVKKQGRGGRGPLIARASTSVTGNKLDNTPMVKAARSNKPASEKNGSKSGRPLKKLSDRKGFSRLGNLQNGASESTGKSDDDREELLAAANHARNASYLACSSAFWKKFEPIFAPVSTKDKTYLSTQLKEPDFQENFPQFHGRTNNVAMSVTHEVSVYDANGSAERNMHVKHQGSESFSGRLDSDKTSKEFIPLFQRVLSALIIEDTANELEDGENTENIQLQDSFGESAYDTFHHDDFDEPRKRARMEVEQGTVFQSTHSVKLSFSSNGCTANTFRSLTVNDSPCGDAALAGISKNLVNRPQVVHMEGFGIPSFDNNQHDQMRLDDKLLLELHSIGLYPELVPKLDDKEDEAIKQELNQLKTKLRQQNYKKKAYLEKICRSVGYGFEGRDLEQLAMDRLVEIAYRKLLATKGPSRGGTPKIPKHVALAFGRRTLSRCRKFGKSGVSCFNVAPLKDILFAPPDYELEPPTKYIGFQNPHPDSRISSDEAFAMNGPISNRGKKKELLLDDVGTAYGGATGKRAYQGERKMKATTKQKAGQAPTQSTRTLHPVQPSLIRESRMLSHGQDTSRENVDPLNELDPIDELGVGGPQDLSSLLNFDDDELQDHFSAGLEIPMDDLTELNMF